MKKILCIVLAFVFSSLTCCEEANALFGNTHFNLGKKIIEQANITLSESEENAFLSGLVYADIGRFRFDKETGIESDSDQFVTEMKKFAESPEEKWFARGFEMHVFQDKETGKFLNEVLGKKDSSYSQYIMDCSLLDSYFLKKNGGLYNEFLDKFNFEQVSSGMDMESLSKISGIPSDRIKDVISLVLYKHSVSADKQVLTIYDNLIKETYRSLGFEISLEDIHEQAANIVGSFIITAAVAGKMEIPEELALKIEKESDHLAKLCTSEF